MIGAVVVATAVAEVGALGSCVDNGRDSNVGGCVGKCRCRGLVKIGYIWPFGPFLVVYLHFFDSTGRAIKSNVIVIRTILFI